MFLNEIYDVNLAYLYPAPDKRLTSPGEHIFIAQPPRVLKIVQAHTTSWRNQKTCSLVIKFNHKPFSDSPAAMVRSAHHIFTFIYAKACEFLIELMCLCRCSVPQRNCYFFISSQQRLKGKWYETFRLGIFSTLGIEGNRRNFNRYQFRLLTKAEKLCLHREHTEVGRQKRMSESDDRVSSCLLRYLHLIVFLKAAQAYALLPMIHPTIHALVFELKNKNKKCLVCM